VGSTIPIFFMYHGDYLSILVPTGLPKVRSLRYIVPVHLSTSGAQVIALCCPCNDLLTSWCNGERAWVC